MARDKDHVRRNLPPKKRCTVFCIAENTTIGNVLVWFMMAHAYGFCHPEKQTVGCTFTIFSLSHSILIFGSIARCLKIVKKSHFTKLRAKRANFEFTKVGVF